MIAWFAVAFAMTAAPTYIAEVAPPDLRGTLVALKEAFIVGGMVLGYGLALATDSLAAQTQWRVTLALAVPFALASGAGVWMLPPSPRYRTPGWSNPTHGSAPTV